MDKIYILNDKFTNIINNKTEHFNIYDTKGLYKFTCVNCRKYYVRQINRNFKEHKEYFYVEGCPSFANHVKEEGMKREIWTIYDHFTQRKQ